VSGKVKTDLVDSVRVYYLRVYHESVPGNSDAVIAMLEREAKPEGSEDHAREAITAPDSARLFDEALPTYVAKAQTALGSTYGGLSAAEKVAVVDLAYNVGHVFSGVADDLVGSDFVKAGFDLVDAKRTTQGGNLQDRTEAEYENLLAGHLDDLGQLVS